MSKGAKRVLLYVPGGGFQLESQLLLKQLRDLDIALVLPDDSVQAPWMAAYRIYRVAPLITRAERRFYQVSRRVASNFSSGWRALRDFRPEHLICVGSSICVPGMLLAAMTGVDRIYIESITRTDTISGTGRLIERVRLASRFYVQWPGQAHGERRVYHGTVL